MATTTTNSSAPSTPTHSPVTAAAAAAAEVAEAEETEAEASNNNQSGISSSSYHHYNNTNNNSSSHTPMGGHRKYLCNAPRPEQWDGYAEHALQHLSARDIQETIDRIRTVHNIQPKMGPGRKSNAEHAIHFYEHLLEHLQEKEGDDRGEIAGKQEEESVTEPVEETDNKREEPLTPQVNPSLSSTANKETASALAAASTAITKKRAVDPEAVITTAEDGSSLNTEEFIEQHNDLCDVCEGTGELLMCSTCNLVFHLPCVRPVLTELPQERNWRCAYCILSTEPKNTKPRRIAAAAVRLMARLRNQQKRKRSSAAREREKERGSARLLARRGAIQEAGETKGEVKDSSTNMPDETSKHSEEEGEQRQDELGEDEEEESKNDNRKRADKKEHEETQQTEEEEEEDDKQRKVKLLDDKGENQEEGDENEKAKGDDENVKDENVSDSEQDDFESAKDQSEDEEEEDGEGEGARAKIGVTTSKTSAKDQSDEESEELDESSNSEDDEEDQEQDETSKVVDERGEVGEEGVGGDTEEEEAEGHAPVKKVMHRDSRGRFETKKKSAENETTDSPPTIKQKDDVEASTKTPTKKSDSPKKVVEKSTKSEYSDDEFENASEKSDADTDAQTDADAPLSPPSTSKKRNLALLKLADTFSRSQDLTKLMSGGRGKRSRKQPTLYDPQSVPARMWRSDEKKDFTSLDNTDVTSIKSSSADRVDPTSSAKEDDAQEPAEQPDTEIENPVKSRRASRGESVWCNFCRDDPAIKICCFCACRVCFGKHNQTKLLLCDMCDEEYHTFCLDPPLDVVPQSETWYCPSCSASQEKRGERAVSKTRHAGKTKDQEGESSPRRTSNRVITSTTAFSTSVTDSSPSKNTLQDEKPEKRGPGRPRGRPPKHKKPSPSPVPTITSSGKRRGRPPKNPGAIPRAQSLSPGPPRKRGRPPKNKSLSPSVHREGSISTSATDEKKQPRESKKERRRKELRRLSKRRERDAARAAKAAAAEAAAAALEITQHEENDAGEEHESMMDVEYTESAFSTTPSTASKDSAKKHVLVSRSGRTVKRSSFHDEIDEGEQHLRSSRYGMSAVAAAAGSTAASETTAATGPLSRSSSAGSMQLKRLPDLPKVEMVLENNESIGKTNNGEATYARNYTASVVEATSTVEDRKPAASPCLPDQKDGASSASSALPQPATNVTDRMAAHPTCESGPLGYSQASDCGNTKQVSKAAALPANESASAFRLAHASASSSQPFQSQTSYPQPSQPLPSHPQAQASSSSGGGDVKVPRRKPGARECMQMSRRFGARVISDHHMEILLDYCQRGKVEHLIRMRERLDDHSRFLEMQLAGLEALVKEKGESNVVVPMVPPKEDAGH